jgi:HD-GYP domain-containing protein (c-di-GMP phosphodiesterase class II)
MDNDDLLLLPFAPDLAPPAPVGTLSLAEILASLSYALDLTSGQSQGHTVSACLIALRLGALAGMDSKAMTSLHHAMLLKDSGCSSNAARMFEIYGSDDIQAKHAARVVDWSNLIEAVRYAAHHALPEGSLLARARQMLKIAGVGNVTEQVLEARCTRGASIATSLGLDAAAADCIRCLDEHWDGHGAPRHLAGAAIPLSARIACLSQTLEVFAKTFGLGPAYEMIRARSGRWFDPDLVQAAHEFRQDDAFWRSVRETPQATLLGLELGRAQMTPAHIDGVCDAYAQIVDAKSGFTGEHSSRVCGYALEIADGMGITGARRTTLRRAALLHDIGKLAVPNTILDKDGKPTEEEWACIRRHPFHTVQILGQITGFERLTAIAGAHHERLDGRGYFRGLAADQLDLDMRILAVADVFDALSADRPYRSAMPPDKVFAILDSEALDRDCVGVLRDARRQGESMGLARAA